MNPLEKRLTLQNMLDPSVNKFEKGMKVYYVYAPYCDSIHRLKPFGIVHCIEDDSVYIKKTNEHFILTNNNKPAYYVDHTRLLILTESDFN